MNWKPKARRYLTVKSKLTRVTLAATVKAVGLVGKTPVFGLLKNGGTVYTKIIPDTSPVTLFPVMAHKIVPDSIVYTDDWQGYNVLDVSDFPHFRINHWELFADKRNHINGIENFWSQAVRHMRKFNGVPKAHFELF